MSFKATKAKGRFRTLRRLSISPLKASWANLLRSKERDLARPLDLIIEHEPDIERVKATERTLDVDLHQPRLSISGSCATRRLAGRLTPPSTPLTALGRHSKPP